MCQNSTEKRNFIASFSVRISTSRVRFELADAVPYGGVTGLFRVRINRRWHDAPDGTSVFFNRTGLAALLASAALGELSEPPQKPELTNKMRVSVLLGQDEDGSPRYEGTWTYSPPILAHDGRWHIAVFLFGKGVVFVPCEQVLVLHQKKRGGSYNTAPERGTG